eukprot:scaffold479_cov376-Prasinococcus_capsulatus_cf.AAC.10
MPCHAMRMRMGRVCGWVGGLGPASRHPPALPSPPQSSVCMDLPLRTHGGCWGRRMRPHVPRGEGGAFRCAVERVAARPTVCACTSPRDGGGPPTPTLVTLVYQRQLMDWTPPHEIVAGATSIKACRDGTALRSSPRPNADQPDAGASIG